MKSLIFIACLLFSTGLFSQIKTTIGNFPIIVTSGHGGKIKDNYIQRDCISQNCISDLYTNEVVDQIIKEFSKYNKTPYTVKNYLHRSVLDVNRNPEIAFNDLDAKKIYYSYHSFIDRYICDNAYSDSLIILLDIHGHSGNEILFGYNIPETVINSDTLNRVTYSGFNNLNLDILKLSDAVNQIGNVFSYYGFKTWPNSFKNSPERYFNGGYTIERYKDYPNTITIQIELPKNIRKNQQKKFAKVLVITILNYYSFWNSMLRKS